MFVRILYLLRLISIFCGILGAFADQNELQAESDALDSLGVAAVQPFSSSNKTSTALSRSASRQNYRNTGWRTKSMITDGYLPSATTYPSRITNLQASKLVEISSHNHITTSPHPKAKTSNPYFGHYSSLTAYVSIHTFQAHGILD